MSNPIKLSILICSLRKRLRKLSQLQRHLGFQTTGEVEILVETDDGEMPIGAKRNLLLQKACGEYAAFIDDDDLISRDYISKILNAVKTKPDCCSLQGEITHMVSTWKVRHNNKHTRRKRIRQKVRHVFIHSIKYDHWFEAGNIYYRCPNHLNTIKRELALQVKFPEINSGEDKNFSERIYPLLKTEVKIEGTIYHYLAC